LIKKIDKASTRFQFKPFEMEINRLMSC